MTTNLLDRQQRPGPQALLAQLPGLYRRAAEAQMSLSAFLEQEDPSGQYPGSELDAFERQLQAAGIRTTSDPGRGVYADTFDAFLDPAHPERRALIPEWAYRQWRKAALGQSVSTRALYTTGDQAAGTVLSPVVYDDMIHAPQLAPAVPLSALIAMTANIRGAVWEAFYLTDDAAEERLVRVGEAADIPVAQLTGGDHTIRLHKYGRGLLVSYERLRRAPLDLVAFHIQRLAIQNEVDKVAAALDIAVNGDGNASTAATSYNLTTLDSGTTANNLTLLAWLAFRLKFANPYTLTTVLAQEASALKLLTLSTGTANIPFIAIAGASNFGTVRPMNPQLAGGVMLGVESNAPSGKLVGLDARTALLQLNEIGGNINETERFIRNQTELLTITEVNGFAVLDQLGTRVLNLAA